MVWLLDHLVPERSLQLSEDVGYTCETAGYFWLLHVYSRWEQFLVACADNEDKPTFRQPHLVSSTEEMAQIVIDKINHLYQENEFDGLENLFANPEEGMAPANLNPFLVDDDGQQDELFNWLQDPNDVPPLPEHNNPFEGDHVDILWDPEHLQFVDHLMHIIVSRSGYVLNQVLPLFVPVVFDTYVDRVVNFEGLRGSLATTWGNRHMLQPELVDWCQHVIAEYDLPLWSRAPVLSFCVDGVWQYELPNNIGDIQTIHVFEVAEEDFSAGNQLPPANWLLRLLHLSYCLDVNAANLIENEALLNELNTLLQDVINEAGSPPPGEEE